MDEHHATRRAGGWLTRRRMLRQLGIGLAAMPLGRALLGCSDSAATPADAPAPDAASGADAASGVDAAKVAWATGGTAAMTGQASYPNPFASGAPTVCALTCEVTQGPCWDSQAEQIQDISYGQLGLPTRFYFQIVDDACAPVAGATIDVWHVAATGKYSGNDSANEQIGFCTANDPVYTSALFFRGKQVTDASGVAYFDSCYPGWYSGRTIHVHFIITVDGQSTVTSQFVFDDTLNDEIVGTQPIYSDRGARDTTNATDTAVPAASAAAYSFETQQMPDGALLAWKTVVVRASSTESSCQLGGGGMAPPGGGGMPPGDGGMPPPRDGGAPPD